MEYEIIDEERSKRKRYDAMIAYETRCFYDVVYTKEEAPNKEEPIEKPNDSDDEDFKQFELGLANRNENVRNSHQRIKDKDMPKLSDRNIKPEHDILSMASSELNRLGKN